MNKRTHQVDTKRRSHGRLKPAVGKLTSYPDPKFQGAPDPA